MKKLFHSNYDKNERPVVNDSDTVTVVFGLTLNQIVDVVRIIFSFFIVFCIISVHRLYPKDCLKKKKQKKKNALLRNTRGVNNFPRKRLPMV